MAEQRLRDGERHRMIDHQRARIAVPQPVRGRRVEQRAGRRVAGRNALLGCLQYRLHFIVETTVAKRVALLAVNQRHRLERRGFGGQTAQHAIVTQQGRTA